MDETQIKALRELNAPLLAGRGEIRERSIVSVAEAVNTAVTEGQDGSKVSTWRAKVSHANKLNQNRRIYPEAEMAVAIDRVMREKVPHKAMLGAVDHMGAFEGGNLKNTCIIWHKVEMQADGQVFGEFSIVEKHSKGADLKALIEAGVSIGFSTSGYGRAYEPTDEERAKYGLGEDDYAVVIREYEMVGIDSVDNPSERTARLRNENTEGALTDSGRCAPHKQNTGATQMEIKTLEDLKAKLPEVFALHEAALAVAVEAATKPLKAQIEKVAGIGTQLAEALGLVTEREVTPAEAQEKLDKAVAAHATEKAQLEGQVKAATEAKATADAALAEATAKIAAVEADKAEAKRVAEVTAKAVDLTKGNKFADAVVKAVAKAAEAKDFTADKVEALVAEKVAEYAAVLEAPATNPAFDIDGITDDSATQDENAGAGRKASPTADLEL